SSWNWSMVSRWGTQPRLLALLPVSWPSFQMGNCDDDNLFIRKTVYDLIRKLLHQHPACSVIGRESAYFRLCLNEGCRMNDGIKEFRTQSGQLLFVPKDGGGKLFACCFEV